jgi:hypothetical protein
MASSYVTVGMPLAFLAIFSQRPCVGGLFASHVVNAAADGKGIISRSLALGFLGAVTLAAVGDFVLDFCCAFAGVDDALDLGCALAGIGAGAGAGAGEDGALVLSRALRLIVWMVRA